MNNGNPVRILLTIEGGVLSAICADHNVEVIVVDYDFEEEERAYIYPEITSFSDPEKLFNGKLTKKEKGARAFVRTHWNTQTRPSEEVISIQWAIEDIEYRAKEIGVKVSRKKALEILARLKKNHDCNLGITWDTIDSYLL